MNYTNALTVGLMAVGLSACITPRQPLENIPLMWKPTSAITLPAGAAGLLDTKVQFDAFNDVRKQPELIAENHEEAATKSVTTRDNVGDFVAAHVRSVFDRMGLTTVDSGGDVVVSGEVRQFFVDETTTYKGRVLLHINVRSRTGAPLWNGAVTGESSRFGHSYSAENYYEVFSDSLINAVSALVEDPDFQAALRRKN